MKTCVDSGFVDTLLVWSDGMDFLVRQDGNVYESNIHVVIQDDDETVFNIRLPSEENTVNGWRTRFAYLCNTSPETLNDLLAAIPELLETQVDDEAHQTYLQMLHALFKWLEDIQEQTSTAYDLQTLYRVYKQLERALFRFKVDGPHNGFYEAVFSQPGEEVWRIKIPSDKFDRSPVPVSHVVLTRACENYSEQIEHFIDDFVYFQAHIVKDDPKTFNVFFCLSKALVKLIRQETTRLGMYISRVPDICAFIVKNELDREEQKTYLELILSGLEQIGQRLERLDNIIKDIQNEIPQRNPEKQLYSKQQKEEGHRRLMHVISIISNHFLMLYDFSHSANFWKKANIKDPLLWFFLTFHRRPLFYLLGQALLLGIPTFLAYQRLGGKPGPLTIAASDPLFFFILIWYVLLFLAAFFILAQIIRKRWLYSQLLLPRFLGAAIVGLVPLLLYDQSWLIRIQNSLFNLWLLVLSIYVISFIFMFINVYNILKLVPGPSMTEILQVSRHVFAIALSETLFIVTIASTLILPALLPGSLHTFGISISLGSWLSFEFFPALIILWTGIALFIGSFVQLWGQGQRITEPI